MCRTRRRRRRTASITPHLPDGCNDSANGAIKESLKKHFKWIDNYKFNAKVAKVAKASEEEKEFI